MISDATEGQTQSNAIDVVRREVLALNIDPNYRIGSAFEAVSANDALSKVKTLNKIIVDAKSAEIVPLNEQIKEIRDRYRDAEGLLLQAEEALKGALVTFRQEENKRIALEKKAADEAAAKERARLEEEARKEREKAAIAAEKLRAKGQVEKADALIATTEATSRGKETVAAMVAAPTKAAEVTTLAGASFREVWVGKVTDLPLFLQSLSKSSYDISEIVTINQAALNRLAKSLKGNMDKALPGAIAWPEQNMAVRTK
jgi:hypothetical protein